jgi:hypothetical protein
LRTVTFVGDYVKTCTKCEVSKPEIAFSKRADAKDGLSHWCKFSQNHTKSNRFWPNMPDEKPSLTRCLYKGKSS